MSFKDLENIKSSYNSVRMDEDLVNDFYIPVLSHAKKYDRISGYFTSTSLAIAARGISKFIEHNGHMRLICGNQLNQEDVDVINDAESLKDIVNESFLNDYFSIEDGIEKDYIKLLGWMIANNFLEIKIGFNMKNPSGSIDELVHTKTGILYDDESEVIFFNGSVNETASGWGSNLEIITVDKSWEYVGVKENRIDPHIEDFEYCWNGEYPYMSVMNVPEASKRELIKNAPKNDEELRILIDKINKKQGTSQKKKEPRNYQLEAISKWKSNDFQGILAMATGTGKTITALSCFDYLNNKKVALTVIVCPQKHLISQWEHSLFEDLCYDGEVLIASGDFKWKKQFLELIGDLMSGIKKSAVVFTTFNTFSKKDFIDKINYYDGAIFLIIDEVHGIGALEFRKGLLQDKYDYRLGLSATPEIKDDFERTDLVYDYFGGIVYEYSLEKAIKNGFLTHYNYHPEFVNLNESELEDYKYYTSKIANLLNNPKLTLKDEKILNGYLKHRRDIINNAEEKYKYLRDFLEENTDIKDLIIYCTGEQLPEVRKMLDELDISNHKFTGEESTKIVNGESERDKILRLFKNGHYQVLIGIKCLDEGVDVPSTQTAILMASTLNSRQHIQRRGRVLRKSPGKDGAEIYDLIVFPNIKNESDSIKAILENERARYDEYANLADNFSECSRDFMNKWEENR